MERATSAVKLKVAALELFERDVRLRMPFRFGVVTLTESPQAFVRARIRTEDGREAEGAAAELLAPKWFDKNPALSNEDNYEQLRASLRSACERYLAHGMQTPWRHSSPGKGLVENYGPALVDRAVLDALLRALGISFYKAIQQNIVGAEPFEGIDLPTVFAGLKPVWRIAARHTVGLVDPITASDIRTALHPSTTGFTRIPIRLVWGTNCYGQTLGETWCDCGAKATAGARYVNFYPTSWGNFIDAWNTGTVSFNDAVANADTAAVRTVVQTFIAVVDAKKEKNKPGGFNGCPLGSFVTGDGPCAREYFVPHWLAADEWQAVVSGKDNMNYSSYMARSGDTFMTKHSVPSWT